MKPELWNEDVERALLGAVMLGGVKRYRQATTEGVKPETFAIDLHQRIWKLYGLCEARGSVIDLVTMGDLSKLDRDVVTEDYLIALAESPGGIGEATVESYSRILLDTQARREMFALAKRVGAMCLEPETDLDAIRTEFDKLATAAHPSAPFKHFRDVDDEGGDTGCTTGYKSIDLHLSTGGYPDGQTTIVRAYHKTGKSTFMLSSFMRQLDEGRRVLYATFADLSDKALKRRMKRALSTWSKRPQLIGDQMDAYERACGIIDRDWDGYVYNAAEQDEWSIESFASWLRYQQTKTPFHCVFVDYAQKLSSSHKQAQLSEYAEAKCASRVLQRLSARLMIPIVIGSQITEGNAKTGAKAITKGSRIWEEDAGLVITLEREDDAIDCEITFSRFGPSGVHVPMTWNAQRLRVEAA